MRYVALWVQPSPVELVVLHSHLEVLEASFQSQVIYQRGTPQEYCLFIRKLGGSDKLSDK